MVADRMGVSVSTVNTYLDRVRIEYAHLGRPAATKAALLVRAIRDGLISLDECRSFGGQTRRVFARMVMACFLMDSGEGTWKEEWGPPPCHSDW
ncbi:hypothetical protein H4W33_000696 [Kibdelosporangium phytohabitans]|nr:hypothetical protein [Kibdelosporangium phytohabitans]